MLRHCFSRNGQPLVAEAANTLVSPAACATAVLTAVGVARRYPWGGRKDQAEAVLKAHPKLGKIVETYAANANVKKWLSERGAQGF